MEKKWDTFGTWSPANLKNNPQAFQRFELLKSISTKFFVTERDVPDAHGLQVE